MNILLKKNMQQTHFNKIRVRENDISQELMGRLDPNEKLFIELFWVYLSYIHCTNLFGTVPEKINNKDEISIFFKSRYV